MLHSLHASLILLLAAFAASGAAQSSDSIQLVQSHASPSSIIPDGTHNQHNANADIIRILRRFPQNPDYVALAQELEQNGVVAVREAQLIQKAFDSLLQAVAAANASNLNAATARSPASSVPTTSKLFLELPHPLLLAILIILVSLLFQR